MGTFDGSGALGMLGENPIPQGTPDELRAAGLDPAKVGSCAPRSEGVRGCPLDPECIFGQARYGGFKGVSGPHNIGYYKREVDGTQKQDVMTCHGFVRSLVRRMRAGDIAREEGKPHEQIRIIAQEGEWITINPIVQTDPNDKRVTAEWKRDPHKIQVPKHPRPSDNPQITYDQQLWAEEQIRRKYDPEFAGAPPILNDVDQAFDMGDDAAPAEGVIAEPVNAPKK